MIRVDRSRVPAPEKLAEQAAKVLQELKEIYEGTSDPEAVAKLVRSPRGYPARDARDALKELFHRKCAYCESPISGKGDIENFRPRLKATHKDQAGVLHTDPLHYFWLANEWDNLYLSCGTCNLAKGELFPVSGKRAGPFVTGKELEAEEPLLLDPCADDPESHLRFDAKGYVEGTTERGKVTVDALRLNREPLVAARRAACVEIELLLGSVEAEIGEVTGKGKQDDPTAPKRLREECVALSGLVADDRPYAAVGRTLLREHSDLISRLESMAGVSVDLGIAGRETRAPSAAVPGVINDAIGGRDCLDIEKQVDVFAQALVSKEVSPPLAIGLFGEWGAGKSFFMDLLHGRVAARVRAAGNGLTTWRNVCQIRFNAWHYMDADLWVGLAAGIFDGIAAKLGREDNTDFAEARRKLTNRLNSTMVARDEAIQAEETAAARLEEAREELGRLGAEREEKLRSASGFLRALWTAVGEDKELETARDSAAAAAKRLGIRVDEKQMQYILAVPKEAESLVADVSTAQGKLRSLAASFTPQKKWHWAFGLGVLFLPVGVPWVLDAANWLCDALTDVQLGAAIDKATLAFSQVGLALTAAVGRIRSRVQAVSELAHYATGIRAKGDSIRQRALEKLDKENVKGQEQAFEALQAASTQLAVERQRIAEMELLITETQRELEAISAGKLVYEFLLERVAADGTYRSREGIVSIVRRDLETLSHLLSQWRKDKAVLPEPTPFSQKDREGHPIQRIILYIDDLDRCPPKRVVEVLQAVHLLLAFDLFVVVVGVDPRWLERSLVGRYRTLIGDEGLDDADRHHPAATPRDYLEKIFQVPFSLPKVGKTGFEALVAEHLKTRDEIEKELQDRHIDTGAVEGGDAGDTAAEAPPGGSGAEEPTPIEDDTEETNVQPEESTGTQEEAASVAEGRFFLEEWEREFMSTLHPFIRTPRLVKRFVNVYRLLRVGVPETEYEEFTVDRLDAEYRVVLVLLAVNTAYPRVASTLLHAIASLEWLSRFKIYTWDEFVESIRPPNTSNGIEGEGKLLPALNLNQAQLGELSAVYPLLSNLPAGLRQPLDAWSHWAPRVGRYSLYWRG